MKSKRLISLLCAAAMTTSAFAGLVTTASAATKEDILWSDTFNNAATGVFLDGTNEASLTNDTAVKGMTFVTGSRGGGDRGGYKDSEGNYIYNGSYYAINEKEDATDKYVRLSFPVFADAEAEGKGRYAKVDFAQAYAPTADKDVIFDFDLKVTDGIEKGEKTTVNPVLRFGSYDPETLSSTAIKIDKEAAALGDDWVDARIIVSNTTGAKLYINGKEITSAADAGVKSIPSIILYSADGQGNCGPAMADIAGTEKYDADGSYSEPDKLTQTPIADIDNMIIYNEAAGVATGTSAAPGAQAQEGGSTPAPKPTDRPTIEQVAGVAPALTAPDGVSDLMTADFNNDSASLQIDDSAKVELSKEISGGKMTLAVGGRSDGDDNSSASRAEVVEVAGSTKAVKLTGGRFARGGRSPRLFTDDYAITEGSGETAVLGFSVYMSKTKDEGTPSFWLIDTNEVNSTINDAAAESGGYGMYTDTSKTAAAYFKGVYGYFTSETFEDGAYTFGGSKNRGVTLEPDKWHTVVVAVSDGPSYRIFVDGQYRADGNLAPVVNDTVLSYGTGAYSPANLPAIAIENVGSDQPLNNSVVLIDNVIAYKSTENVEDILPVVGEAPTPGPTTEATPEPTLPPLAKVAMTVTEADNTATVDMTSDIDTDAVLIQASYNTSNVLTGIKTIKPIKLTASTKATESLAAITQGDKIMLWDNTKNMRPLAATYTVKGGAAPATAAPTAAPATATPGVVDPSQPTATPGSDTPATATPTVAPATAAPTAAPTATPTAKPQHEVAITAPTNGTVKVMNGTTEVATGTKVEEGTELTVVATPDLGYLVGEVTVTGATVANNKFTVGTTDVTVAVTFTADPNLVVLNAEASTWVKKDDTTPHGSDELLKINQWIKGDDGTISGNETALIRYAGLSAVDKDRIVTAKLNMDIASVSYDDKNKRWADTSFRVGALKNNTWNADTAVYTDYESIRDEAMISTGEWTTTKDPSTANTEPHGKFCNDNATVTSLVKAATEDKISIELATNTARAQVVKKAPKLVITLGQAVTFTVKNSADPAAAVANATIDIYAKDAAADAAPIATAKTAADGTVKVALPSGEYTYKVTSADYAIKKDVALTVANAAVSENVTLAAKVPTTVEITSPAATIVSNGKNVVFTAKVKDQDGREMADVPLTWSIVDAPANIAVTNGTVSVTEGVVAGEYKVKAAVTDNPTVSDTADFTVKVAAPATVTVKYQDTEGNTLKEDDTISENLFVEDSFTLAESYQADIKKDDTTSGTFEIYKYDATATGNVLTISSLEATNTIIVKFTTDGKKYYVFEEFGGTGSYGFDVYSGSRGSATGATIADGELKISTNGGYPDANGAARYKTFDPAYSGKIAISFDAHNNGDMGKKRGAQIVLSDGSVTAANGVATSVTETNVLATINLHPANPLTVNGVTVMDSYDQSKHNFKFVIDFDAKTIEAYYDGTQVDLDSATDAKSATIAASSMSLMKVKALNSASDTLIDNLVIEKVTE